MTLDPDEDIIITVTARTAPGKAHADFLAAELATALDNLCIVEVLTLGEFGHANSADERRARFDQMRTVARAGVKVLVVPGDDDEASEP